MENKIRQGESIHESVQHHVNRRDDALLYGALPAALIGAVGGAIIGAYECPNLRVNEYAKSLNAKQPPAVSNTPPEEKPTKPANVATLPETPETVYVKR